MKTIIRTTLLACFLVFATTTLFAQQPGTKVTLGIKLDYFFNSDDGGVRVKGLVTGKVAAQAGIKAGDIIIAMDNTRIRGLFHYRDLLSEYSSGDRVKVKVKRQQETLIFNIQFE